VWFVAFIGPPPVAFSPVTLSARVTFMYVALGIVAFRSMP